MYILPADPPLTMAKFSRLSEITLKLFLRYQNEQ